jgi:cytochrome c peroxidase
MTLTRTVILAHGEKTDAENQGRGIPNYLGPATVSPDGSQAFVPGKQDNIKRGTLRDGQALNFQNTVRAISSRIALTGTAAGTEVLARRVDHDNASLASAVAFDKRGTLMFVALETSREIAVVDAFSGAQLMRFDSGRAPQGLALSADGNTLFVQNFMDRSITVHDLRPLLAQGLYSVPLVATLSAVTTDRLSATVLRGKQFFYDARDPRLARDGYMSCASCHSDGGHDGRVWDFTGQGEGLRNTTALRGRAGAQGKLHWSANFDEVQDFEGQIRSLAGGTGLMTDALFNAGTRSQPLGDRKTGQSADLDALAAYVGSLTTFDPSPLRNADGSLSAAALSGKSLFQTQCLGCHGTAAFTTSAEVPLQNVGTLKASSGKRLGTVLPGIDPPTLRDAWSTAPYLHDGSATTLSAAISAHTNLSLSAAQMAQLAAYVGQIGSDEADPTPAAATGTGLTGSYFNNTALSGTPALTRTENVDFNWDVASPGPGIGVDQFSVRWAGKVVAPVTGSYVFRTETDDGVRVWVNGVQVINNWTDHGPTVDSSIPITLAAGQRADIVMEYYENGYGATARLLWLTPGATGDVAIPAARLLPLSTPTVVPGLVGSYFNNLSLSGTPAFTRSENVEFDWGEGSPGTGVGVDSFSVRWTGKLTAPVAGTYVLQTEGDDGMRMWVNGTQMVNDWTDRGPTLNNTPGIVLTAGQQVSIVLEYYENGYGATARLRWKTPGSASFVIVPVGQLTGP